VRASSDLLVNDVAFRVAGSSQKLLTMMNTKNHGKMVIRSCSRAHTQTVNIRLNTSATPFIISVLNTVACMVAINWSHSSAALKTVAVLSTRVLL